jgi:hypothetical protein
LKALTGGDALDPEGLRDRRVGRPVSSLARTTSPSRAPAACSRIGPSARHGAHQSAQKSTDDGGRARALDDLLLEVLLVDFDDGHAFDDRTLGVDLYVEEAGEGIPVVLLHGLTATHRYVVMGSKALERSGHHVIAYDARGHGRSDPAPAPDGLSLRGPRSRTCARDGRARTRARGARGRLDGRHTLLRFALERPERVSGIVVNPPAYDPDEFGGRRGARRWDALADALRTAGSTASSGGLRRSRRARAWRDTVFPRPSAQRLADHEAT